MNNKIEKQLYTPKELAKVLNCSLHKLSRDRSLYGHDTRYLPWIKINGAVRYPIQEVQEWLRKQKG